MAEAFIHPLSDSLFSASSVWTKEENKRFERALALFDEKTPDRWRKVAEMIPGKSMWDVMRQYRELEEDVSVIEAGLVDGVACFRASFKRRKTSSTAARHHHHEQERRKGVPWTEEEHRRFLLGLEKHGKGDWRSISRNFVISKTPTQVASHAQKYFLRQLSIGKDKKRPSIHDITTANLMMPPPPSKLNKPNHPLQLQFQLQNLYSCG